MLSELELALVTLLVTLSRLMDSVPAYMLSKKILKLIFLLVWLIINWRIFLKPK